MLTPRISQLLDEANPPGTTVVYGARAGAELSGLGRVSVVQRFKPDCDALAAQGVSVVQTPEGRYDLAIVLVPRSKAEARALIADATTRAAHVIVDGSKTDGIDSIYKDVRKRVAVDNVISKAHGKAFAFAASDLPDWSDPGPLNAVDGFETRLGVFSADRIDKASQLLVDLLPETLPAKVADLGAGWGFISRHVLARSGVEELHVVEADATALDCARTNLDDPRVYFHWADARTFTPATPVQAVVMNPPFHTSRAADPALGQAFIESAARILTPNGQLWLVANRQLPYEATLANNFAQVQEIGGTPAFKVLYATKPFRGRSRKP